MRVLIAAAAAVLTLYFLAWNTGARRANSSATQNRIRAPTGARSVIWRTTIASFACLGFPLVAARFWWEPQEDDFEPKGSAPFWLSASCSFRSHRYGGF